MSGKILILISILALVAAAGLPGLLRRVRAGEDAAATGKEAAEMTTAETTPRTETAIFAAGCFWGVEAAFQKVEGVTGTAVGYTGGHTEKPTYEEVCNKGTGHAEAVKVIYDPERVGYRRLLEVFFAIHDPTQVNRQGPDVGDQYRSAVFTLTAAQRTAAEAYVQELQEGEAYDRPIATEITPAGTFWPAEDYHQDYYRKRGLEPRCHIPG
jgi:methionine-S-sulfoxide reductase